MTSELSIPFQFEEIAGIHRDREPVSFGVPFPKGRLNDLSGLTVNIDGEPTAHTAKTLNTWSDGSVKWALLNMQATIAASASVSAEISHKETNNPVHHNQPVVVEEKKDAFYVSTGGFNVDIDRNTFKPFSRIQIGGEKILDDVGSLTKVKDASGVGLIPIVQKSYIESHDELKAVLSGI